MGGGRPARPVRPNRGRKRFALGLLISAGLLALLARAVNPDQLGAALATADLRVVAPAMGLYFLGLWLRAVRWRLLLPPGSGSTGSLFQALAIGFAVNNVLPARLGEVARAYLLHHWRGVPYGNTVASVVVERVLDGLALAGLLLLALRFVPAPDYLQGVGLLVGAGFAGGAVALGLIAWRADALVRLVGWLGRPLPPRYAALLVRLAAGFARGLGLVRGWRLLARLAALSLGAWLSELGLFYALMLGFPRLGTASFPLAVVSGTVANFATLLPSSPGYVGTFDSALVKVLSDTAGTGADLAAAFALVAHVTLLVPVTLLGGVFLWRANLSVRQITRGRPAPAAPRTAESVQA